MTIQGSGLVPYINPSDNQSLVTSTTSKNEKYKAKSDKLLDLSFTHLQQNDSPDGQVSMQPDKLRGKITRFLEKAKAVQPETEELQTNIQKLNEVLDHLKVQSVKIDCGKAGELEFDKEHLVKIPFFKTILEQFGEFDNAERVLPLPNNLTPNQLLRTYAYAEKGEIAETTIDPLMEQYLVSSFLEYQEYEKALHAKIIALSPMSLETVADMDFGLFERSIDETFAARIGQFAGSQRMVGLVEKIVNEKDAVVKEVLMNRFIIFNNCLKAFQFNDMEQFAAFMKDAGKDSKALVKFIGFSFKPKKLQFDEIILHLIGLTNIEEVKFPAGFVTDYHLEKLKELKPLRHLDLSNCQEVTTSGLEHLSSMPNLTRLNLQYMSQLCDDDLKPLVNLEQLEWLNLSHCTSLTDICLEATVSELKELSFLNLSKTHIWHGLLHLQQLKKLTHLDISFFWINGQLSYIASMTQLTHLNLESSTNLNDNDLSHLSGLVNLTHLNLSGLGQITNRGLEHLTPLVNLTHLSLFNINLVTNDGLRIMSHFVKLVFLDMSDMCGISDDGLSHISCLKQLRYLKLCHLKRITNEGMRYISELIHLTYLDLDSAVSIKVEGLEQISKLMHLAFLNLVGLCDVTDVGMLHLSHLPQLKRLILDLRCKNSWINRQDNEPLTIKSFFERCDVIIRMPLKFEHTGSLETPRIYM